MKSHSLHHGTPYGLLETVLSSKKVTEVMATTYTTSPKAIGSHSPPRTTGPCILDEQANATGLRRKADGTKACREAFRRRWAAPEAANASTAGKLHGYRVRHDLSHGRGSRIAVYRPLLLVGIGLLLSLKATMAPLAQGHAQGMGIVTTRPQHGLKSKSDDKRQNQDDGHQSRADSNGAGSHCRA